MSNLNRTRLVLFVGLLVLAAVVRIYKIIALESDFLLWLHGHSTESFDHLVLNVNAIGGPKPVFAMALGFALIGFARTRKVEFLAAIPMLGMSAVLNLALRDVLHRHRPDLWHTLIYDHSFIWSFPGGHACLAASLATAINLILWETPYRRPVFIGGIAYCMVVAFTSVILGVHYPLDIIGGWISGFLVVSLSWSFVQWVSTLRGTKTLRED